MSHVRQKRVTIFLTAVGGGAFGNPQEPYGSLRSDRDPCGCPPTSLGMAAAWHMTHVRCDVVWLDVRPSKDAMDCRSDWESLAGHSLGYWSDFLPSLCECRLWELTPL